MSGYPLKRIEDFCRTGSGGTPSRSKAASYYEGGTIPWVKSGELRENLIVSTEEQVTNIALRESSIKLVPAGAILLAMYGATVGRLAILGVEATTNQAVCHIVPDPKIADTKYVYHALSAQVPEIVAKGVGGAQPNISQGLIRDLRIALPSLPEQRRVAAILDKADALRVKRREALAQLDRLAQSIFIDMFGNPVSNSKNWPTSSLEDILQFIGNGINIDQTEDANGWPVSRIETIWNGEIDPDRVKYSKGDLEDFSKYRILDGDILFSHINSPNHIAKTAIYLGNPKVLIHGINLLRLRGYAHIVDPKWLVQLLKHSSTRNYFQGKCKRAVNQASLNQQDIKEFRCIIPPLAMQQHFSRKVDNLSNARVAFQASKTAMDRLFSSLQKRAFQGAL